MCSHCAQTSLMLYRCENGLQFKLVATEDEETEGPDWKFGKNDRFGPKHDMALNDLVSACEPRDSYD